jgi:16S rRNA (uracil1498-N3)-methyltransferase
MARRRFFVEHVHSGHAEIEGEEARHLTQVLRVEAGQKYEISDNQDVYLAEVKLARKQQVVFRVLEKLPGLEPAVPVALYVALIKFERLEVILEKATELGAGSIHLVQTDRSEKGLERAAEKRFARWRRIILESSQQSRRSRLPELLAPVRLREALAADAAYRLWLDEERNGGSMLNAASDATTADSVAMLIGPEGGWTPSERGAAISSGWKPVSLGPNVLRTETAAIAALAALNAILYRERT